MRTWVRLQSRIELLTSHRHGCGWNAWQSLRSRVGTSCSTGFFRGDSPRAAESAGHRRQLPSSSVLIAPPPKVRCVLPGGRVSLARLCTNAEQGPTVGEGSAASSRRNDADGAYGAGKAAQRVKIGHNTGHPAYQVSAYSFSKPTRGQGSTFYFSHWAQGGAQTLNSLELASTRIRRATSASIPSDQDDVI